MTYQILVGLGLFITLMTLMVVIAYSIEAIVNEQNAEHDEQAKDAQPKYVASLEEDQFHFFKDEICGLVVLGD
jgi:hypothetical protein